MKKNKKKAMPTGRQGFTLVELLLVMSIMGILAAVVFVSLGKQRQKTKMNAVLQTVKSVHAIAQECRFRIGDVNLPNDLKNPTNEVCDYSRTIWPGVSVDECQYSPIGGTSDHYYSISCPDFGKRIRCGIMANESCVTEVIP
jgi:prepilin-type N-terminal cleavage/methylation domain-containing protein